MARRNRNKARNAASRNGAHHPVLAETIQTGLRHHQAGELAQAEVLYRQVINADSDHPAANHLLGLIAYKSGAHEAAIALMERSIRSDPKMAPTHLDLGTAYRCQGRFDEAVRSFRKAIELQPRLVEAHRGLGKTLREMGQLTAAFNCLQTTLFVQPNNADTHIEIGVVLKNMGRTEEAITAFHQARDLEPDNGLAELYLGGMFNELESPQQALPHCREAVKLLPDYTGAHNTLGCTLLGLGELDEATESFRKAIILQPDYHACHNNLAVALQSMGQLKESATSYRESLIVKPDQPTVQFNLSIVYTDLGQHTEAIKAFRDGMKMIPVNFTARPPTSHSTATENLVALMHLPRSGSMFLHSLLDGHPEITTTPGVYFKGFFGESVWETLYTPTVANPMEQLVENFCYHYDILFDARSARPVFGNPFGANIHLGEVSGMTTLGEQRDQWLSLDRELFQRDLLARLREQETVNLQIFFQLIHETYDQTLGRMNGKKALFYHIHNPDLHEVAHFLKWHPQARFLFLMRDPLQGLESWLKAAFPYHLVKTPDCDEQVNQSILNDYLNLIRKIQNYFNYLSHPAFELAPVGSVRLEDIKRRPRETMPSIARWIGVGDHESLYESTFQDLCYWGPDSKVNPDLKGFDTANIDRKSGLFFSKNDQLVFQTLFHPARAHFGYVEANETEFRQNLKIVDRQINKPLDFERALFEGRGDVEKVEAYNGMRAVLRGQLEKIRRDPASQVGSIEKLPIGT